MNQYVLLDSIQVRVLKMIVSLAWIIAINALVQQLVRNVMDQLIYEMIVKKLVFLFVQIENIIVNQV